MSAQRSSRIVIGMSGGVDSSVAAWLLRQQGHEVIGLFMKNWEDDEECMAREDWVTAASVADLLGIEIEAVNFAAEYRERVFSEFLREYAAGRTPNPDVLCNAEIKFRAFLDHAMSLGAERIATGHYARVRRDEQGLFELLRGVDAAKDQSYFLHRLTQEQLSRTWFPLGELDKSQVRELARSAGLPNAERKDSTGICFIGERPFREFLGRYLPTRPGPIETADGQVIGEHQGLAFHTIGQRRGLRIGGTRAGSGEPWFVARKDMARNALIVVQGHAHPALHATALRAIDAHWIAGSAPHDDGSLTAKTRYRQQDARCALAQVSSDDFRLRFAQPQWAITPGQSAVLYRDEVCLGGGVIEAAEHEPERERAQESAEPALS